MPAGGAGVPSGGAGVPSGGAGVPAGVGVPSGTTVAIVGGATPKSPILFSSVLYCATVHLSRDAPYLFFFAAFLLSRHCFAVSPGRQPGGVLTLDFGTSLSFFLKGYPTPFGITILLYLFFGDVIGRLVFCTFSRNLLT